MIWAGESGDGEGEREGRGVFNERRSVKRLEMYIPNQIILIAYVHTALEVYNVRLGMSMLFQDRE